MTATLTPPMSEAEAAFWRADSEEWLHGRRCGSPDCQACRDLMDATNAARKAWDDERARRAMGRAG